MFNLYLDLDTPVFVKRLCRDYKGFFNFTWNGDVPKTRHKFWEIQVATFSIDTLISLRFNLSFTGEDHAGLNIQFDLLGLLLSFQVYDHRHWDYDKMEWETYDE